VEEEVIELDFEKSDGLIPAIAQDADTGEVLMMAYVNRDRGKRRSPQALSTTGRGRGTSSGRRASPRATSRK